MLVLNGFISVLLMLTQSHFLPTLDFSTKEENVSLSHDATTAVLHLPVEHRSRLSFAMAPGTDKEKLKRVIQAETRRSLFVRKLKGRNRALAGKKLYILLGQLRTDG